MARSGALRRYRACYAHLLRLYPKPFRERFGAAMEQTFVDVLRERAEDGRGMSARALWMFVETSSGIVRERVIWVLDRHRGIVRVALGTALLLLIPFVAMRFTEEVNWSLHDFVFMGVLLLAAGLGYELVARRAQRIAQRAAVGIVVATTFLLVWVNAAVGIIGDPGGPNLMYAGVLAVGLIGALVVRFRLRAMALPLFAMAIAQMMVPVIALAVARPEITMEPPGTLGVFVLNACFAMLFVAAALLFRRARASGAR
jgi:hypothetical protein